MIYGRHEFRVYRNGIVWFINGRIIDTYADWSMAIDLIASLNCGISITTDNAIFLPR